MPPSFYRAISFCIGSVIGLGIANLYAEETQPQPPSSPDLPSQQQLAAGQKKTVRGRPGGASGFTNLDQIEPRWVPFADPVPWKRLELQGDLDHSISDYDPTSGADYFIATGWQSADVYKDLDKTSEFGYPVDGNGPGDNVRRTSIWYSKLGGSYHGFAGAITYLQSVERIVPRQLANANLENGKRLPQAELYHEIDLGINYSMEVIPQSVSATVGYNSYFPTEKSFLGTHNAGEIYGTLRYDAIPHLTPEITYSHFHSNVDVLRGDFLEFKIETYDLVLYENGKAEGDFRIEFNPYTSFGIDYSLIGDGTGPTSVDFGFRIPIQFNKKWSLILNGNYGIPVHHSEANFHSDVGDVGLGRRSCCVEVLNHGG